MSPTSMLRVADAVDKYPECGEVLRRAKLNNFTPDEQRKIAIAVDQHQPDRVLGRATCHFTIAELQEARGQCAEAHENYQEAAQFFRQTGYAKDESAARDRASGLAGDQCPNLRT